MQPKPNPKPNQAPRRRNRNGLPAKNLNDDRLSRRLRWRCRRGSKELDLILAGFMDTHYARLSAAEQRLFEKLLACADPQLTAWLCHGAPPAEQGMATIVQRILSAHHA